MTQLEKTQQKNSIEVKLPERIPQIVDAIRNGKCKYPELSEELQSNREVIVAAVYMDARIISSIPESTYKKFDEEYIKKLIKLNGAVFPIGLSSGVFPNYLSSDKLLWKDAATSAAEVIAEVPANIFKTKEDHKKFVKEIIVRNPEVYNYLPLELKEDKEIALTLINTNQGVNYLMKLPKEFLHDGEFIEKTIKYNGEVFSTLFKEIKKGNIKFTLNTKHLETAVASDSTIISNRKSPTEYMIPQEVLENENLQISLIKTSINIKNELEARNINLLPRARDAYNAMASAYKHLGIDLRMEDRDNKTIDVNYFDNSKEIIRNRYTVASNKVKLQLENTLGQEYFQNINTDKPICLVLYPKYDGDAFNQSSYHQRDSIDRLCNSHRVLFYQISKTDEIVDNFRESTDNGKNKVSLLVLGGHGDPYSILLSKGNNLNISQSDLYPRLNEFMGESSTVVLNSCSTGAKNQMYGQLNIASFLAGIWPQSSISAPMKDTYQAQISSTLNGSAVSAYYEDNNGPLPRLDLPAKGYNSFDFTQSTKDSKDILEIKTSLKSIYDDCLKTGGIFYFTSRHGITPYYLGIQGREIQSPNMTLEQKKGALGDLLALKIMKNFVDLGIILSLKQKDRVADEDIITEAILKALNLKEKNYLTAIQIQPQNKTVEITIKSRKDFEVKSLYNCKFNYDNLQLIHSFINDPLTLSEIK